MVVCRNFLFQVCKMRGRRSDSMQLLYRMLSIKMVYPTQYRLVSDSFKTKKTKLLKFFCGMNYRANNSFLCYTKSVYVCI